MNSFSKILVLTLAILAFNACESGGTFEAADDDTPNVTNNVTNVVSPAGTPTPTEAPAPVTPTVVYGDLDGDGFSPALDNDCDETNPKVNKFAKEVCGDGIDNNCDGTTDEGVTQAVYLDADKDGYGLSESATSVCIGAEVPKGYTAHGDDCNDSAKDANGDGKVDGYWIHQNATETCDDGIDNNCNGETDEGCVPPESLDDLLLGDNSALTVIWPSDKAGQSIMAVPYYSAKDIGADWLWFQQSSNSIVFTLVPDGNACGVRFNTAHGKPKATEWLCMDDKINPDAVILVIKADGSVLDVTTQVKKWSAPEGGCSANLELHECK